MGPEGGGGLSGCGGRGLGPQSAGRWLCVWL